MRTLVVSEQSLAIRSALLEHYDFPGEFDPINNGNDLITLLNRIPIPLKIERTYFDRYPDGALGWRVSQGMDLQNRIRDLDTGEFAYDYLHFAWSEELSLAVAATALMIAGINVDQLTS